jgi:hypothetical protein
MHGILAKKALATTSATEAVGKLQALKERPIQDLDAKYMTSDLEEGLYGFNLTVLCKIHSN